MSKTDRAQHRFRITRYASEQAFIVLDLLEGQELPTLQGGFLGFDLREDTTHQEVKELADMMNRLITYTTYTR